MSLKLKTSLLFSPPTFHREIQTLPFKPEKRGRDIHHRTHPCKSVGPGPVIPASRGNLLCMQKVRAGLRLNQNSLNSEAAFNKICR